MNRAVKTSLIFIGAIALFFLLIHLETWLTKVEDWLNPPTTSLELFERDIAHEWVESGQWDKALFERQLSRLNDEYSKGNLKKRERASLLSLMGESAWREIDSVFQVQMSAPNSRKAEVDANKKGLDYLTGFKDSRNGDGTPFKESEHISGSLKMYQDYVRAMSFATKNLTASPSIDAHFKWTPFSVIQSRWDSEKDKVASSPYFASHFRNINVVKNRWNEYASLVNSARTSFRNQLSQNLPGVISQALTPIKTEAETERQNGRDDHDPERAVGQI